MSVLRWGLVVAWAMAAVIGGAAPSTASASRADLHRSPVPFVEPRPRRLDPRGRSRLRNPRLLRRPAERPRDQGQQHGRRAASPLGKGAVAHRIAAPRPRIGGPSGEAPSRQRARGAPVDGRSAPKRGRARRHRRPRPHRVPALLLAHARARLETAHREPLLPEHGRLPAIRPREDVGAKRPAGSRRLLGSEVYRTRRDSAAGGWLRGSRKVHAQADDSGSGLSQLLVACQRQAGLPGSMAACDTIAGTSHAARFEPCIGEVLTQ